MSSSGDSRRALERRTSAFVLGTIIAGTAVLSHAGFDLVAHPAGPRWLILAALTALSGWATLRIPSMPMVVAAEYPPLFRSTYFQVKSV